MKELNTAFKKKQQIIALGVKSKANNPHRGGGNKPTNRDLILSIMNKLDKFIVKQEKFNNYVLDMFKKHKWI